MKIRNPEQCEGPKKNTFNTSAKRWGRDLIRSFAARNRGEGVNATEVPGAHIGWGEINSGSRGLCHTPSTVQDPNGGEPGKRVALGKGKKKEGVQQTP